MSVSIATTNQATLSLREPVRAALIVNHTLAHVFLKRRRHREWYVTKAALVRVFANPSVRLHVPGQFRGLRARIGAKLALVRLLACVRASVNG